MLFDKTIKDAGVVVSDAALAGPDRRDDGPGRQRRRAHRHRRAVRRDPRADRRLLRRRRAEPGRRARLGGPLPRFRRRAGRSRCGRWPTSSRAEDGRAGSRRRRGDRHLGRGRVPRGTGPAARRARPPLRRPRPRRGRHLRGDRGGAADLARRRRADPAGRLAADHRAPPGRRPPASRPGLRRPAGGAAGRGGPGGPGAAGGRRRAAGRTARPVLHLHPPRPRGRGPRGADPALPRRAHDAGGGAGVPRAARDDGPADRAGEEEDPGGPHPLPGAGRGRAARQVARCAPGPLLDLHRGLRGELGARVCSGSTSPRRPSAWPGSCAGCCPPSGRSPACSD